MLPVNINVYELYSLTEASAIQSSELVVEMQETGAAWERRWLTPGQNVFNGLALQCSFLRVSDFRRGRYGAATPRCRGSFSGIVKCSWAIWVETQVTVCQPMKWGNWVFMTHMTASLSSDLKVKWWCKPLGRIPANKKVCYRYNVIYLFFIQRYWLWQWGGLLHLKVDQTPKYSGDDNKMSWRHVKISVSALSLLYCCSSFFPPTFPFHHTEPHAWVRPLYWRATFFRNRGLLHIGLSRYYIFTSYTIPEFQS